MKYKTLIQKLDLIVKGYDEEDYLSIIFSGQPGLGKTTRAYEFCDKLNKKLVIVNGVQLLSQRDVSSLVINLKSDEILFIDEVHLASKSALAPLFSALEEKIIHATYRMVNSTKAISVDVKPFVIICATTDLQKLEVALIDRFDFHFHFTYLEHEEMDSLVKEICQELKIGLTMSQKSEILNLAKGNIRVLKKYLKQLKRYKIKKNDCVFELLDLDCNGLNNLELLYVEVLGLNTYSLSTVSRLMKMNLEFIKNVIEPNLLNYGIIEVSSRGRKLSLKGKNLYAS